MMITTTTSTVIDFVCIQAAAICLFVYRLIVGRVDDDENNLRLPLVR